MSVLTTVQLPKVPVPAYIWAKKNLIIINQIATPWVPAYPAQTTYPYHSPLNTSFPLTP